MTEAERAAQLQLLQQKLRNGEVDAGVARILKLLAAARREVLADVVSTNWDRYALPQRLAAIDRQLEHFRQLALDEMTADMAHLWNLGAAQATEAAAAVGIEVAFQEIPTSLLQVMQAKMGQRVTNLFNFAKAQLDEKLTLALLTGQSREEAIAAIGKVLEFGSTGKPEGLFGSISARARFIYQQEVGQAYAVAADLRQQQAMTYASGLRKVWAHDGHPKVPRQGHLLMHGQTRERDDLFVDPVTGDELAQFEHLQACERIHCRPPQPRCSRAVTSISMRMRSSSSPAQIMVAAGRTGPITFASTGMAAWKSSRVGTM